MGKNILQSKTFWFNFLGAAAEITGILPIPSGTAMLVSNGLNIVLRTITKEPVTILPQ